jgi:hypothetical protein
MQLPFQHGDYYVKVWVMALGTTQLLTSPGLQQDEAESALESIGQARVREQDIALDWLSTSGHLVIAAHIQDQP